MMQMDSNYKKLLLQFAGNKELLELLDLVVLDDMRVRGNYYMQHNSYPERIDLLQKLKIDLETTKAYMDSKK